MGRSGELVTNLSGEATYQSFKPSGLSVCHFQHDEHMSSIPYFALKPNTFSAFSVEA